LTFTSGLRSSTRGDWRTPKALYKKLVTDAGRFDVSDRHGGAFDALTDKWPDHWFCNPPYGREIGVWVEQAFKEHYFDSANGVMLLPARTDTRWFHKWVYGTADLIFIQGRLHFDDLGPAHFPSMLASYGEPLASL